jgi:hypothetical protein
VIADHSASAGAGTAVGTFAPPYRGKRGAQRGTGGRFQARGRRRFLAPSRRHPRFHHPATDQAGGRVRSQVSETAAKCNVAAPSAKASRAKFLWRVPATGLNAQAWGTEEVPANNESHETITERRSVTSSEPRLRCLSSSAPLSQLGENKAITMEAGVAL